MSTNPKANQTPLTGGDRWNLPKSRSREVRGGENRRSSWKSNRFAVEHSLARELQRRLYPSVSSLSFHPSFSFRRHVPESFALSSRLCPSFPRTFPRDWLPSKSSIAFIHAAVIARKVPRNAVSVQLKLAIQSKFLRLSSPPHARASFRR